MAEKTEIYDAPEAAKIGEELVAKYHPHLLDARILYLRTSANRTSKGPVVLGTAQKTNPLIAYLDRKATGADNGADFIILISQAEWLMLKPEQRIALVDHELCHCDCETDDEGNLKWKIRGHDVEEFSQIIERHGLWRQDLEQMAEVIMEQHRLPLEVTR